MMKRNVFFLLAALALVGLMACGDDDNNTNNNTPQCGNGIVEGDEACDGAEFAGAVDCSSEGFVGGTIGCAADCTIDVTGCDNCGDGIKDDDETCDGTDFGTATCVTEGHTSGDLTCTSACTIDDTSCSDSSCTPLNLTQVSASCTSDGTSYVYQEQVSDGAANYVLWVELYPSYINGGAGGTLTTGDHTLGTGDESTYGSCAYCVDMDLCADSTCDLNAVTTSYFATAGTLTLTTLGDVGGNLQGSLTGVTFTEWDLFGDDIPVADGECLDVASKSIDAAVTAQ